MVSKIVYPLQPFFVLNSERYYKKIVPHSSFAHFYSFKSKEHIKLENGVVPDGSVDIIFSCNKSSPKAIIAGSVEVGSHTVFKDNTLYFGVRFLPGIMEKFGKISAKELVGNQIDFSEVVPRLNILEKICNEEKFECKIAEFLNIFPEITDKTLNINAAIVHEILNIIYVTEGMVTMADLEKQLLYSRRHLLRIFKDFMGIDIKKFCRIVRFQAMLFKMNRGKCESLAQISVDGGYYDQNHFQKEFRKFTGISPRAYMKLIEEYQYQDRITLIK